MEMKIFTKLNKVIFWVISLLNALPLVTIAQKPNVVFILCDDLNDAVEGFGGHPQTKTPNLTRLRQIGVSFTNNHSNCPLSGPSRGSLWTGKYPSSTGMYGFDQNRSQWNLYPSLKNTTTIFEHFRTNGYRVAVAGKIFHNNHAMEKIFPNSGDVGFNLDYGPFPWDGKGNGSYKDLLKVSPPVAPGYASSIMASWGPLDIIFNDTAYYKGWRYSDGKEFKYIDDDHRDLLPDEISTNYAVDIINGRQDQPFFVTVGMVRPHFPGYVPRKFFDLFPLESIQIPPSYLENDRNDVASILNAPIYAEDSAMFERKKKLETAYQGNEGYKRFVQAYLASVAFMDEQVGKILDALEKTRKIDNTIIVFSSDNGYHLGEKDWFFKRTVWEKSTRVPLIIHVPGITSEARTCNYPVSLIHLYPTLNDLCGLSISPAPDSTFPVLDGFSLRPFLKNPTTKNWDGPKIALSCIFGQTGLKQSEPGDVTKQHFTVRSHRYRYVMCSNGEEELYDHKKDPYEWKNLATSKKYVRIKNKLKIQMTMLLDETAKK